MYIRNWNTRFSETNSIQFKIPNINIIKSYTEIIKR